MSTTLGNFFGWTNRGGISISIKEIDLKPTKEDLEQRVKRGQLAFGGMFLRDAQPYVPLRDGPLRGSGTVSGDGKQVSWESYSYQGYPYGLLQFNTQFQRYTTPGTGPRWDLKAEGNHREKWVSELGAIMS